MSDIFTAWATLQFATIVVVGLICVWRGYVKIRILLEVAAEAGMRWAERRKRGL